MNNLLKISLFLVICQQLMAQHDCNSVQELQCDSLVGFGIHDLVRTPYGYSTSLRNDPSIPELCEEEVIIPYRVIHVKSSDGLTNWSVSEIQDLLNRVEDEFKSINFLLKNVESVIHEVQNDNLFSLNPQIDRYHLDSALSNAFPSDDKFINVLLVNDLRGFNGWCSLPTTTSFVVVAKNGPTLFETLTHEVGHFFGLWHTHESLCLNKESFGEFSCGKGDLIEDTAGPLRSIGNVTLCYDSFDCDYLYTPPICPIDDDAAQNHINNYMSYTGACRMEFTPFQKRKMWDIVMEQCRNDICNKPSPPFIHYNSILGNFPVIKHQTTHIFNKNCVDLLEINGFLSINPSNTGNCIKWFYDEYKEDNRGKPAPDQQGPYFSIAQLITEFPNQSTFTIEAYDIPAYNYDCRSDVLRFTIEIIDEPCISGCPPTPSITYTNQNDVQVEVESTDTYKDINYVHGCDRPLISSGCNSSSWYMIGQSGLPNHINDGATFQHPSPLPSIPEGGQLATTVRVYNVPDGVSTAGAEFLDFNLIVRNDGNCYDCTCVFSSNGVTCDGDNFKDQDNSSALRSSNNDCNDAQPCLECGSTDISEYCIFPQTNQITVRECDLPVELEAVNDCFIWYEAGLQNGTVFPAYNTNFQNNTFTPIINGTGTYYYFLVDQRKEDIEDCGIYLQIDVVECEAIPAVLTSPNGGENLVASSTYEITWEPGDAHTEVRIGYSNDGGNTWIWPEDIGLPFLTDNDGSLDWTIPCYIANGGGFVDTDNAVIGIFPTGSYPVTPIDVSDASFSIGACLDNRVDIAVVATHPDPNTVYSQGDQDYIEVELTNVGTIPTSVDWSWGLYIDEDNNVQPSHTQLCQEDVTVILPPGETITRSCSFTIPLNYPIGEYYLEVLADDGNFFIGSYLEPNEDNNEYYIPIQVGDISTLRPDLTIPIMDLVSFSDQITCGTETTIEWSVQNIGLSDVNTTSRVRLYLSSDAILEPTDMPIGSVSIGSIDANSAANNSLPFTIPMGTDAGIYHIIAVADSDAEISELREDNNIGIFSFEIVNRPDYTFDNLSIVDQLPQYCGGDNAEFILTVTNIGTEASTSTNDGIIVLSRDQNYDNTDIPIAIAPYNLDIQESLTYTPLSFTIPTDLSPGQWYLLAAADYENEVDELDEENNQSLLSLEIVGVDIDIAKTPPTCGESNGSISLTLSNGKAPATYSWSTGDSGSSLTNLGEGTYSVTATDAAGNTSSSTINLFESSGVPAALSAFNIGGHFYNSISVNSKAQIYSTFHFSEDVNIGEDILTHDFGSFIASFDHENNLNWYIDINDYDSGLRAEESFIDDDGNIFVHYSYSGMPSPFHTINFGNGVSSIFVNTASINNDFIVKYNVDGEALWVSSPLQGTSIESLTLCPETGDFFIGTTSTSGYRFTKYDTNGNLLFTKNIQVLNTNTFSIASNWIYESVCSSSDFTFTFRVGKGDVYYDGQLLTRPFLPSFSSTSTFVLNVDVNTGVFETHHSENNLITSITNDDSGNVYFSNTSGIYKISDDDMISLIVNPPASRLGSDGEYLYYMSGTGLVKYDPISNALIWEYELPEGFIFPQGSEIYAYDGKYYIYANYDDQIIVEEDTINELTSNQAIALIIGDKPVENFGITLPTDTTFCSNTSIALDIADDRFQNLEYIWSDGTVGSQINISNAGTYTVTTTDTNTGCTSETSIDVSEKSIKASLSKSDASCRDGGGSLIVVPQEGQQGWTYAWSNGATTPSVENLSEGSYEVTITDEGGCTSVLSESIEEIEVILNPNILVNNATCGLPNGSIIVTDGNGLFYPEVRWENDVTSPDLQFLWPGNYSLTITDINGCHASMEVELSGNHSGFGVGTQTIPPTDCHNNDGGFRLNPTNYPNTDYTFLWDNGSTNREILNVDPGLYAYTVTESSSSCFRTGVAQIPVYTPPNVDYMFFGGNCGDGAVMLGDQFIGPEIEIEWSTGATTPTIENLPGGTYFVTVSNFNNCTLEERIDLPGNPLMTIEFSTTSQLCQENTEVSAIVDGGVSPYTYVWSDGATTQSTLLPVGAHSVTVTDNVGCTIEQTYEILNESTAGLITFEPDKEICGGSSAAVQLVIEGATPPFDITLWDGQQDIFIEDYSLGQVIDLIPSTTTTYSIKEVKDGLGCQAESDDEITITVLPQIQLVANLLDLQICQGTSGKSEPIIIGGTAPYTIQYNDGTSVFSYRDFSNGDQIELPSTANNTYYFTEVVDANGCSFSFIDQVRIIETPCTISNDFFPEDPCSCNDDQSANGAQDGTFSETISVSTTSAGQTWTVTALASLSPGGTLPIGIEVGSTLRFDQPNARHFIDFRHTDLSGYVVSVEGPNEVGSVNNVTLSFQNVCQYPVLSGEDFFPAQLNVCEGMMFDLPSMTTITNGLPGTLTTYVNGQVADRFDATIADEGEYTIRFEYQADFEDNANGTLTSPANPGCRTVHEESFELIQATSSLVCNDDVQVGLINCELLLNPAALLEGDPHSIYTITTADGQTAPASTRDEYFTGLDWSAWLESGAPVEYRIENHCGMQCWGYFSIYNYDTYNVTCSDTIIACDDQAMYGLFARPTFDRVSIWEQVDEQRFEVSFPDNACISVEATYTESYDQSCDSNNDGYLTAGVRTRTWTFTSNYEEQQTCTQQLYERRYNSSDVVPPAEWIGPTALAYTSLIDQNEQWLPNVLDNDGSIAPGISGSPMVDGVDLGVCGNFSYTYNDKEVDKCGSGWKTIRSWSALDWCSSSIWQHTQTIEVVDDRMLTVRECPETITINAEPYDCAAQWAIPPPAAVQYEGYTNTISEFDYTVSIAPGSVGTQDLGAIDDDLLSLVVDGVPVVATLGTGIYTAYYSITDDCGRTAQCSTIVEVIDNAAPIMVCDQYTVTTTNADGCATVSATSIDDGSYDSCGEIMLHIKLEGAPDRDYAEEIELCCLTCQTEVMVEVRATDSAGNVGYCTTTVTLDDKSGIVLLETPEAVIERLCTDPIQDVASFLQAQEDSFIVHNVCKHDLVFSSTITRGTDDLAPGECGDESHVIQYSIKDDCGGEATFVQVLRYSIPNEVTTITWPDNRQITSCSTIPDASEPDEQPIIMDRPCSRVAATYSDQVFAETGIACLKIHRTWTVIDWCAYDPTQSLTEGIWAHVQFIEINDDVAPVIDDCPAPFTIEGFSDYCTVATDDNRLHIQFTDECTDMTTSTIDVSWAITAEDGTRYEGSGTNANGDYPLGRYLLQWTATDHCGNENADCSTSFEIVDRKPPTAYCRSEVVAVIGQDREVDIWASDFDLGGTDNITGNPDCSDEEIEVYFEIQGQRSTSQTFTCDDLGGQAEALVPIRLWYEDEFGNRDHCEVTLRLQAGTDSGCPTSVSPNRTGYVLTGQGRGLLDATIDLEVAEEVLYRAYTDSMGGFDLPTIEEDTSAILQYHKADDLSDGLSTLDLVLIQRHILGLSPLEQSCQWLAADINDDQRISGADIVYLRKLILGIDGELPNGGRPWRFFADTNKSTTDLEVPRHADQHLWNGQDSIAMLAAKVGDVNYSATAYGAGLSPRTASLDLVYNITKDQKGALYIDISAKDAITIQGLQMEIELPRDYEASSIISGALQVTANHYYVYHRDGKTFLRLSWSADAPKRLDDSETLFTISSSTPNEASDVTVLQLTADFDAEAYDKSLAPRSITLREGRATGFEVSQNFPNPFAHETTIAIHTPSEGMITIEVYRPDAKLITSKKIWTDGGHTEYIFKDLDNQNGVLLYCIRWQGQQVCRRMLKL